MSTPDAATVAAVASVLAEHQRMLSSGGRCWCGEWPRDDVRRDTWMDHVAAALLSSEPIAQALAAVEAVARVEALAESWQRESEHPNGHSLLVQVYRGHAAELRAALRPEGGNQ